MTVLNKVVTNTKSQKSKKAKDRLNAFIKRINPLLENYFDSEISKAFGVNKSEKILSKDILNHIKEHCLRPAKRLRGSFIYYGYGLFKNKIPKSVISASISIELVHTALLMHDDFMDQDNTRRGLQTTHEYFKNYHKSGKYRFDPIHYGDSMAVDIGDIALCMGFELLGESSFPFEYKSLALNRLLRGITNTAFGQAYDITLEGVGKAKEKDIISLHHAKTAIYTYENPLHIGAILAGAKRKDLDLISEYAIPGGIAFQLQDDILGLFGDPKKTGKPAHSDLRQGKITLLITKALEKANSVQKNKIIRVWGNKNIDNEDADVVRKIVVDTGSLDYSKKLSVSWAKRAQESIPKMKKLKWSKQSVDYLDGIAQYMVEREM